jgi:glycerophosphoryl diester phosphodiesterase
VGPVPILWDRWELAPPWAPRLLLGELLAAAAHGTELMLDLKGHDLRLPARVLEAVERSPRDGRLTICSQDWRLLEPLEAHPEIRTVHSVGNTRQLARLRREPRRLSGISIHERLLDAAVVEELRRRAALVMSWPVESVTHARRLMSWGVHGLISRSFEQLAVELA